MIIANGELPPELAAPAEDDRRGRRRPRGDRPEGRRRRRRPAQQTQQADTATEAKGE